MQRGGCEKAEEIAAAFRRIVESGMDRTRIQRHFQG